MSDQTTTSSLRLRAKQKWYASNLGQYVHAQEQALYDEAVFDLFGFKALQMGDVDFELLNNSRIPKCFVASEYHEKNSHVVCEDDFLPFPEASLDLLLLPHRLAFSERPHQTLREAARVLMPEGHLVIAGFNPISLWGLKSMVKKLLHYRYYKKHGAYPVHMYPWHGRFIRLSRLKDWLTLLDLEVVSVEKACHMPPFSHEKMHQKFAWLDRFCHTYLRPVGCHRFGGVYFIVAQKRVPAMTLLKPNWKPSKLTSGLVIRPTSSQVIEQQSSKRNHLSEQNKES